MSKRVLLIANPMAGRQKIRTEIIEVIDALTKAEYETVAFTTQSKEKTAALFEKYDSQFDEVICCGGDGTFNEILSATIKWKKPPMLGYIPAGTTNDFASGLNLSSDAKAAIANIIHGTPKKIDAGKFNDTYFSYIASFGAFTETSYSTPQNIKNAIGHLAYIFEGIKEIPAIASYDVQLEVDGQNYEDSFIFGAVCNAKSVGGILKMDDKVVDLNDGLLEVLMVRMPKTLIDLSIIATSLSTQVFDPSMFMFFHTKEMRIKTKKELVWSLDGEKALGGQTIQISCIHDAFKIITV